MKLKMILFVFALLPYLYQALTLQIIDRKRKEPLPAEVADIYTPERWQTFIACKHDVRAPLLIQSLLAVLLDLFEIFTPFFTWMERICGNNVYVLTALSAVILLVLEFLLQLPVQHYTVMVVETKYGLNKKDEKEFRKDAIMEMITSLVLIVLLYLLLTFILQHLSAWTGGFQIPAVRALLLMLAIALVLYGFLMAASWFSWQMMRRQYVFTELPEGELRDQIIALTKGAKKKIHRIEVYNESKKSTTKNAFMLKLLWYRQFGIADNFLQENSERQLLGVLAHEAGHLKHKKNIWNYLTYAFWIAALLFASFLLPYGAQIAAWTQKVLYSSFGITEMNYMLLLEVLGWLGQPLLAVLMVYRNFVTRQEEYEADRNAVKEGYGEDLIETFRELSSDELVDVNPADCIEFLEYDHPGMYHRICAIRRAIAEQQNPINR